MRISKKADSTGNDDNSNGSEDDGGGPDGGNDAYSNDSNFDKADRQKQDDHNTSKIRKDNTDSSDSRRRGKASRNLRSTDPPSIRRAPISDNAARGSGREGSPNRESRDGSEGEGKRADRGSGGQGGGQREKGREGGGGAGGRESNPDSLQGGDDDGSSDRRETRSRRRSGDVIEGNRSTGSKGGSAEVKKSGDGGNDTDEGGMGDDQGRAVNVSNKTLQQHRQTLRQYRDDGDGDEDDSSKDSAGKRDNRRRYAGLGAGDHEQQQQQLRHQGGGLPQRGKVASSTSEKGPADDGRSSESSLAERRSTGEDRLYDKNDNAGSDKRRRERDARTDSSSQELRGRRRRLRNGNAGGSRQRFPKADGNDHRRSGDDSDRMEQTEGGTLGGKGDGAVGGRTRGAVVDGDDGMRAQRRPSERRKVNYEDRGSREGTMTYVPYDTNRLLHGKCTC